MTKKRLRNVSSSICARNALNETLQILPIFLLPVLLTLLLCIPVHSAFLCVFFFVFFPHSFHLLPLSKCGALGAVKFSISPAFFFIFATLCTCAFRGPRRHIRGLGIRRPRLNRPSGRALRVSARRSEMRDAAAAGSAQVLARRKVRPPRPEMQQLAPVARRHAETGRLWARAVH